MTKKILQKAKPGGLVKVMLPLALIPVLVFIFGVRNNPPSGPDHRPEPKQWKDLVVKSMSHSWYSDKADFFLDTHDGSLTRSFFINGSDDEKAAIKMLAGAMPGDTVDALVDSSYMVDNFRVRETTEKFNEYVYRSRLKGKIISVTNVRKQHSVLAMQ